MAQRLRAISYQINFNYKLGILIFKKGKMIINHIHLHQIALEEEISNFFDILVFSYVQWPLEIAS